MSRKCTTLFLALVLLVLAFFGGGGWYFSSQIESDGLLVQHDPPEYNLRIVSLSSNEIVLSSPETDANLLAAGTWGIESQSAYGLLGPITRQVSGEVTREFTETRGVFHLDDQVRLEKYVFTGDPLTAHGISFRNVNISGPLGPLPAWFVPGTDDTWVIFIHGRTGDRQEALRMLPVAVEAGFPSLVISYRGDEGAAADPSGYYGFGLTEWLDLESAVQYAMNAGARDVVLAGLSMGGAIAVNFMYESGLSNRVARLILDSPMMSFEQTIDHNARSRDLPLVPVPIPPPLTATAKWLASTRFGIDFDATDYMRRLEILSQPILLFHGDMDPTVPVDTSRRMASLLASNLTYVECPQAVHMACWNVDQGRYETRVRAFLETVAR